MPEEALKHADFVIKGEAEEAFPLLAECLSDGGDLSCVPDLVYTQHGAAVHSAERPLGLSLDGIPIPDFSLVQGRRSVRIMPATTTWGCPPNCRFCCVSPLFGCRCRMKSIEGILEELRRLGKVQVFFCDDNFTMPPERTKTLLSEMLRRRIVPARWYAQVRADTHRETEMLSLMKRTNCTFVFVGFGSTNQNVLNGYNKHLSQGDIARCISAFHAHGIPVHRMFMFGADEDEETAFERTVQFALAHQIDTVQFLVLTPVPGSTLFKRLDSEGRIFTYDWTLYDGHHVVFEPARMSPLDLQIGTMRAMGRFYSSPSVFQSLSCMRFGTAMLRYAGRRILRGWHRTNARFLKALREWQRGRARFPRRFPRAPLRIERFLGKDVL